MTKEILCDIIQWDVKSWSKALSFWEEKTDWNCVHQCLEIGGREGGLALWLALKDKQVVCSDLSDVQATAERLHNKYPAVKSLITYRDIDATAIPYENHFDIIIFKSIMGGVGRDNNKAAQQQAFDSIYKALKPGGKLLFAENLIASPLHRFMRKRFVKWGDYWRYVTIDELGEFTNSFSSVEIIATGFLGTFGRSEAQRNLLTSIDNAFFNHICPDRWKYIAYGIATK